MSNLSALRKTLKNLGSNTAQFFRPPALQTQLEDVENTAAPEEDDSIPSAPNGFPDVSPTRDAWGAIDTLTNNAPEFATVVDDAIAILTAEQRAVAEAPAHERQLVIAGPGTGKTFTVIRRLEYLLGRGGLETSQILVLSFSRSAVREIRTRLRARAVEDDAHGDLDFLPVWTFDAFAYRLLLEVEKTPSLSSDSYDENILMASRAIRDADSDARDMIAGLQHLIVDELQDLVGPRAVLVENILKAMSGGFTLLGDPAQAIYDYQARQNHMPASPSILRFLRSNSERWHLKERSLTSNLRGVDGCFAISERHRPMILNTETSHEALEPLQADLATLPDAGTASQIDNSLRHISPGKSVAILCRTNSEALQVHMHLLEQKIPHVLAVNIEDTGLPAWVGRIFSVWTEPDITQTQFLRLWEQRIGSQAQIEPDQAWQALIDTMGLDRTRRFRMDELRNALASRPALPDGRNEDNASLTVSTIHRAKGREYDWVVLLESNTRPHHSRHGNWQDAEEARVLYVAATRAREHLSRLRRGNLGKSRYLPDRGRSYMILRGGNVLVEVGNHGDVDDYAIVNSADVLVASQDYLWHLATDTTQHQMVNLIRARTGWGYSILAQDDRTILGHMSSLFGADMELLSEFLTEKISSLLDVPIRTIETAVLGKRRGDLSTPYNQSRLCLVVRLQGAVFAGKQRVR